MPARSHFLALTLILSLFAEIFGQQPATTATPQRQLPRTPVEDEVVRISTNLVQVDAVVTKDGKPITNLRAEDFEILEDGQRQQITNFSYVSREPFPTTPEVKNVATPPTRDSVPVPARRLDYGEARRTMALVVDDMGLDFQSTIFVRDALKKFVDEEVKSDDLVAIIRTGKDSGVLQQLTTDKQQLHAAVARIKYNQRSREGIDQFTPMEPPALSKATVGGSSIKDQAAVGEDTVFEEFRDQVSTDATLVTLSLVIRGLGKLPGRKSVVLFSNGIRFSVGSNQDSGKYSAASLQLHKQAELLMDHANRSSVVIYTIDPRGLTAPFIIRDNPSGSSPDQLVGVFQSRATIAFYKHAGLSELAERTGGFLVKNTNDILPGLRRIAAELEGYYLIGYRPSESTFDEKTGRRLFRTLKVKVKRPGLSVRSRTGFLAVPDKKNEPASGDTLAEALISPFEGRNLRLRLTSLFANDLQMGSFMRSLIHVDANDLTFTEEPDGRRKAVFDVAGATFGANGFIVHKIDHTSYTMRVSDSTYKRLLQTGFVYTVDFPIKKAGAYQLRFSIRDQATQRVSSTGYFVVVPDLASERLALSGIILRGRTSAVKAAASPAEAASTTLNSLAQPSGQSDEVGLETEIQSSPAVRRFQPGTGLDYAYLVYNARTTSASPRPQVTAQVRLFGDGKLIYTGKENVIETAGQEDLKRLSVSGELQLGDKAAAGEYTLQIVVKDLLASEKRRIVSQWIDFEIVK